MSKQIPLTQNLAATVDDCDYEAVSSYKWYAAKFKNTFYACRKENTDEGRKIITMHRQIMNCPEDILVDHRDGNGLCNVRSNLRLATYSQNGMNRRLSKGNSSGVTGVSFNSNKRQWKVDICVDGEKIFLGYHSDFDKAVSIRRDAEAIYFGEFANGDENEVKKAISKNNIVTYKNNADRKIAKNNVSGVNGVSWNSRKQMWQASLYTDGKRHHLGWHKELQPAIEARRKAEIEH